MSEKEIKETELKLLNLQLFVSSLIVIIGILSFLITYNLKLKLSGKNTYFTEEEVRNIAMIAKILALIAASLAVYISFQSLKIAKFSDKNVNRVYLEIAASLLTFAAAVILIIVVYKNNSEYIEVLNTEL